MLQNLVIKNCQVLKTHEANITDFLCNQLAKLKTLSVHGCIISNKATELIKVLLMKTTLLANFNMSSGKLITTKAAELISVFALSETTSIKSLNISRNWIIDYHIEDLVSAVARCQSLEELNISHNLLTFTSVIKIAEGLRGHCNLRKLNLSNNLTSFNSEGEFLVDVILSANQSLVYLNICGRNIRPRFSNDHLLHPPNTEVLSNRFPLQNLYLSRLPTFDMFTFESMVTDMPSKFIEARKECCPFTGQYIVSYYVDHDGGTFYNQDHDFAIVVPPGAVLQGDCVEIRATASLFGPFQFPSGHNPVSSFFWASSDYDFKIPVYFIMSHYAVIKNINDITSLCVLQTCAHDLGTSKRKPIMTEVLNGVYFDCKLRYCVLKTQHFCSFSAQERSEISLSKRFKVYCYEYTHPGENNCELYFFEVCFCPDNCDCSKVTFNCVANNHKL